MAVLILLGGPPRTKRADGQSVSGFKPEPFGGRGGT